MISQVRLTIHLPFVFLVLALELSCILVPPALGLGTTDDQINCWSRNSDSTCARSNSCSAASVSTTLLSCYPNIGQSYRPYPEYDSSDCDCGIAASVEESALYDGTPSVSATFETVSVFRFNMEVHWSHSLSNSSRVRGYQVRLQLRIENQDFTPAFCYCVQGSDKRSLAIKGQYFLMFSDYYQMLVEVQAYPLPPYGSVHPDVTGKNCSLWSNCVQDATDNCGSCKTFPSSCLDLGLDDCHPPKFPPPTSLQLFTLVRPLNETERAMQLDVLWGPPVVQEEFQIPIHMFTYFLRLKYLAEDGYREKIYFNASGNGSMSISVFPLDLNVSYTVNLLTHYRCAGTDDYLNGLDAIGCGPYGPSLIAKYVPLATTSKVIPVTTRPASELYNIISATPSASQSSVILSSTPVAVQTTSSSNSLKVTPSSPPIIIVNGTAKPHPLMEPSVIATIASLVAAFLIIISILSTVLFIFRRHRSNVGTSVPETLLKVPVHMPIERKCLQVFVMYSPRTNPTDKEYILMYVVNGLRRHCRLINVTYPDHTDFIRGCVVGKMEEKVKQSQAVLIVCNNAFQQDWEDQVNSSQHVRSLRQLIYSNVGRNQKFALVTLDNDPCCAIPSEYLKSLKKFNIGERGTDEKDMIHFVTNTSPYQLAHSQDLSPLSDITANLCHSQQSVLHSTTPSCYSLCETGSLPLSDDGLNLLSKTLSDEDIPRSSDGHKESTESPQVDVVVSEYAIQKIPNFTKSHTSESQHQ